MKKALKRTSSLACAVVMASVFTINVMACTIGNPTGTHDVNIPTGNTGEQYVSGYTHQYVEKIINGVNFYSTCTISCFNITSEKICACGKYSHWDITGGREKHSITH